MKARIARHAWLVTGTAAYAVLTKELPAFALLRTSLMTRSYSLWIILLLLSCGDVHPHPGPAAPAIDQQLFVLPSLAQLVTVLVITIPGDGLCFIHVSFISMATCLHATLEQQEVLRLLRNEIIVN